MPWLAGIRPKHRTPSLPLSLLGLLVVGCAAGREQPAGSQALLEQFPEEGEVAHARFGHPCASELASLQVVHVASQSDAQDLCETSEAIVGCTKVGLYPLPTIVLDDEYRHTERATVTHEMMHFLLVCSGKDQSGDPQHKRQAIWGLQGMLAGVNTQVFELAK